MEMLDRRLDLTLEVASNLNDSLRFHDSQCLTSFKSGHEASLPLNCKGKVTLVCNRAHGCMKTVGEQGKQVLEEQGEGEQPRKSMDQSNKLTGMER